MIFHKSRVHGSEGPPSKEKCLSIIGLLLAIGIIGGLAGLIYGLITGNFSATISGAIVLGVSIFFTIIFVLIIAFCLKNNNTNSNTNENQHHHHHHRHHYQQHQQQQQRKHDNSLQEIKTISTLQKYEPNNVSKTQMFSSSISTQSPNKTNHTFTKHVATPSSNSYNFNYLNESHSSINSNSSRQNNYNRH